MYIPTIEILRLNIFWENIQIIGAPPPIPPFELYGPKSIRTLNDIIFKCLHRMKNQSSLVLSKLSGQTHFWKFFQFLEPLQPSLLLSSYMHQKQFDTSLGLYLSNPDLEKYFTFTSNFTFTSYFWPFLLLLRTFTLGFASFYFYFLLYTLSFFQKYFYSLLLL